MARYLFSGSIGAAVGVNETFVVDAPNEGTAYDIAYIYWEETVQPEVGLEKELTEDDPEYDDYEVIN